MINLNDFQENIVIQLPQIKNEVGFESLPPELFQLILSNLDYSNVAQVSRVNPLWHTTTFNSVKLQQISFCRFLFEPLTNQKILVKARDYFDMKLNNSIYKIDNSKNLKEIKSIKLSLHLEIKKTFNEFFNKNCKALRNSYDFIIEKQSDDMAYFGCFDFAIGNLIGLSCPFKKKTAALKIFKQLLDRGDFNRAYSVHIFLENRQDGFEKMHRALIEKINKSQTFLIDRLYTKIVEILELRKEAGDFRFDFVKILADTMDDQFQKNLCYRDLSLRLVGQGYPLKAIEIANQTPSYMYGYVVNDYKDLGKLIFALAKNGFKHKAEEIVDFTDDSTKEFYLNSIQKLSQNRKKW